MILSARPFAHAQPNGRRAVVALLVALASCADPATTVAAPELFPAVEAKNPPPTTIPVTSTISNADATGLLLTRSDNPDGPSASYGGNINSGAYQLYLGNQSVRKIWLTLASQGMTGIPDGYYSANVEVYTRCFDASGTASDLTTMTNGMSNTNCSFGIDFASGRTKYKLVMHPDYAGTGHATVTCVAPATGPCTTWTVASDPAANVARLFRYPTHGSLVFVNDYHNSYALTFSR